VQKYIKIFLFVFFVAMVLAFLSDIFSNNPRRDGLFVISRGDNILQIAGNLQNHGYIGSRILFIWDVASSGNLKKLKAGRYQIGNTSTDRELIEKFTKFQFLPLNISITPGKTTNDIAQILSHAQLVKKDEFLNLVLNKGKDNQDKFYSSLYEKYPFLSDKPKTAGLEGYLFPDTYSIDTMATSQSIVDQILNNLDKKLTVNYRNEIKKQNRTVFEVLTMASILEKEVKTQEDKQIVAGILWKRADNGLPLEVDSTLLYFLASDHPDPIDKSVDSQYNTYRYAGLPVGPICNPGIDSIMAAINPKSSDYWFYLSDPSGKTIFAKTLGQHLINKAKYLTN
jgi:UPF0755 protein